MKGTHFPKKRILFDWHIPDFLPEVVLNCEEYVKKVIETGTECVVLMAKSDFGCSYYSTDISPRHRTLNEDIFEKIVPPLKKKGISVLAYYNVIYDNFWGEKEPDWRQVDSAGNKIRHPIGYRVMCMNSPYRNIVFKKLQEIISKYPVDGIWLDGTYFLIDGCFCKFCREKFFNKYGIELTPELINKDSECKKKHAEFKRDSRKDFWEDVRKSIISIKKDLIIGGNSIGDFYNPDPRLSEICDFNSREMHPPDFLAASIDASYFQSQEIPFERMVPETIGSWGDWTVLPERTMFTMVSQTLARGGGVCIGHVAYPSGDYKGKVAEPVWNLIQNSWKWADRIYNYCTGTNPLPVAAILCCLREYWEKWQSTPLDYLFQMKIYGAASIFHRGHIIYDIIDERFLKKIDRYEIVYLPDCQCLTDGELLLIKDYVANGGKLLITLSSVILDSQSGIYIAPTFQEITGCKIEGEFPYTDCYIDEINSLINEEIPEMPLLVRTGQYGKPNFFRPLCVKPFKNSKVMAYMVEPIIETEYGTDHHIYHLHAPPCKKTEWPAIIHHRIGKGEVIFSPLPIEVAYWQRKDPHLQKLILNCLKYINIPEKVSVEAPSDIEVIGRTDGKHWYIHFIHIPKDSISGLITERRKGGKISCYVKGKFTKVQQLIGKNTLSLKNTADGLHFCLDNIDIHEIIRLSR